jgi:hypothetical protein
MKYALATLALLATTGVAHSQHPPSYGIQQDQRSMPAIPDARLCRNALAKWPMDHMVIVQGRTMIDCGGSAAPMYWPLSTDQVNWYRTHRGYRVVTPGEGPND